MKLKKNPTLKDLQEIIYSIYGVVDDRCYDNWDIFSNQERFMMRALKGIRKKDFIKLKNNLMIATSWFLTIMNRLHINLGQAVFERFPYVCSYCAKCPCICGDIKPKKRKINLAKNMKKKPLLLRDYQRMFEQIYPISKRTLEHVGIHLAEEQGELSEAMQLYYGSHNKRYFVNIVEESADYFSCLMGVFSLAVIDFEKEMRKFYSNNCHKCHKAPCKCDFVTMAKYKS
jgi:NTP pyrophosphatase (non-canonical NTP hydrolase)